MTSTTSPWFICATRRTTSRSLTVNKGRAQPYQHGDGYGHVAFAVDDLDAEHRRFGELGLQPADIKEFHRDGALMARFFFVQDPDGYKIEVLQRHGRYR